jgi:preprotein translocase subunit SecB
MSNKPGSKTESAVPPTQEGQNPEFLIQRLYLKDVSFESPQTPEIFKTNVQPAININISTTSTPGTEENSHEVVLTTTITAAQDNKNIFLIEVKQAGIFIIKNIPKENLAAVLNVTCPTILFPYLRETVTTLASKGGFPNFYLSPINFEALYLSSMKQQKEKSETTT